MGEPPPPENQPNKKIVNRFSGDASSLRFATLVQLQGEAYCRLAAW